MNNEEPTLSSLANIQISEPARALPEQAAVTSTAIPRPISFVSLIHQWQPMGIRVIVDLPYVSNDKDPLFLIRNGPFIADWREQFFDASGGYLQFYAFQNMANVVLSSPTLNSLIIPKKFPVHLNFYDSPPFLSQISKCFRRWRGDMQYRIRVISGFVTQGYIIVSPIKNTVKYVSTLDPLNDLSYVVNTDTTSYRAMMQNAYVMADTSIYRHIEVTYPYEYPVPWYDQYQWMHNRLSAIVTDEGQGVIPNCFSEPYGDNWLAVSVRGALETTQPTSQISFELEYRALEGFQFADPSIPPVGIHQTSEFIKNKTVTINSEIADVSVLLAPNPKYETNGVGGFGSKSVVARMSPLQHALTGGHVKPASQQRGRNRPNRDASVNTDSDSIALKILDEFPDVPMERLANLNRSDPDDREVIARVHQLVIEKNQDKNDASPPTEGIDEVDERTPSQRRRDLEFQY